MGFNDIVFFSLKGGLAVLVASIVLRGTSSTFKAFQCRGPQLNPRDSFPWTFLLIYMWVALLAVVSTTPLFASPFIERTAQGTPIESSALFLLVAVTVIAAGVIRVLSIAFNPGLTNILVFWTTFSVAHVFFLIIAYKELFQRSMIEQWLAKDRLLSDVGYILLVFCVCVFVTAEILVITFSRNPSSRSSPGESVGEASKK